MCSRSPEAETCAPSVDARLLCRSVSPAVVWASSADRTLSMLLSALSSYRRSKADVREAKISVSNCGGVSFPDEMRCIFLFCSNLDRYCSFVLVLHFLAEVVMTSPDTSHFNHSVPGLVSFVIVGTVLSILSLALRFWSRLVTPGVLLG